MNLAYEIGAYARGAQRKTQTAKISQLGAGGYRNSSVISTKMGISTPTLYAM